MPLPAVCYVSCFPSTIEALHSLYQALGRRLRNLVIVDCHVAWSRLGIYKIERLQDRTRQNIVCNRFVDRRAEIPADHVAGALLQSPGFGVGLHSPPDDVQDALLEHQPGAIWRAQGDVGQSPLCPAASGRNVPPKEALIAVVSWRLLWQSYDEGAWNLLGSAFLVLRMFEHGAFLSPMSRHSAEMH